MTLVSIRALFQFKSAGALKHSNDWSYFGNGSATLLNIEAF